MKIATVVGARPQFIKAATVSRAIAESGRAREVLIHTGQHYDQNMSDVFFDEMGIPKPDYHLGIGGGLHGAMTGRQLEKIEEVLMIERPECVLVYGDTNSTLAGALAASKLHIPVVHVESGLRSFNRRMPEEINRVVTDHLADLLFCPSTPARDNLASEGIDLRKVRIVGDVMCDAAVYYSARAFKPVWLKEIKTAEFGFALCTIHRAENTEDSERLRSIFLGLQASKQPIILPLHPRTRARMKEADIYPSANVHLVEPVGYLEMVWLESRADVIVTDSGGIQKEAYFHQKPCVVLRDETEWMELVDAGCNVLVGVDPDAIRDGLERRTSSLDFSVPFYGTGHAAGLVVEGILSAMGCD